MRQSTRLLAQAAIIAALYVVMTHLQNMLFPSSASMSIQFRASEALCILAFFTPSAIAGLTVGCFLFNLTSGAALPLDFLVGSLASFLACTGMWHSRRITFRGFPVLGMALPTLTNAILVGWELHVYVGGAFWYHAICVAIGETAVLLLLGTALYYTLRSRSLDKRLFR